MATIAPFKAYRPINDKAHLVASPPYDVIDYIQAKKIADSNPYSFLRIEKAEVDFDIDKSYSQEVYQKAANNLDEFIKNGTFIKDKENCLYIYRLIYKKHTQTGIVACTLIDEYFSGVIKKHELTNPQKQKDRMEHIKACGANTGPILMAYKNNKNISDIIENETIKKPVYNFTDSDNVRHIVWVINEDDIIQKIVREFEAVNNFYIADGHHRSAAAAEIYKQNPNNDKMKYCMSVLFEADELNILGYHRLVTDIGNISENELFEKISQRFYIMPYNKNNGFEPIMPRQFGMFFNNRWYILNAIDEFIPNDIVQSLDVSIIYNNILLPVFGINDVRNDKRLLTVGGKNGIFEIEKAVITGMAKIGFALYPVSMSEIMSVSDTKNIMPPKTTWFEPKLKSGLFVRKF